VTSGQVQVANVSTLSLGLFKGAQSVQRPTSTTSTRLAE
jgi:hypothetical protein